MQGSKQPPRQSPQEIYLGLRNTIFSGSREKFGLPAPINSSDPWGIVMDIGMERGTATITAVSDGNASIYLSSGGGYIGGFSKPLIRTAALNFVKAASDFSSMMKVTTEYPLPQTGQIVFYAISDAGVFTTSAAEEDLRLRRHPLTPLFAAGQNVVTQYRLNQQQQPRKA